MRVLILFVFLFPFFCGAAEILKWKDKDGNVHYGDRPPADVTKEIVNLKSSSNTAAAGPQKVDGNFLIGRWRSDEMVSFGTAIPSQVYVFTSDSQGVEGRAGSLKIEKYEVSDNTIKIVGGLTQVYIIVDSNTVEYVVGGGQKNMILHRI
jgi:Domain of unknown function (DUF4124)